MNANVEPMNAKSLPAAEIHLFFRELFPANLRAAHAPLVLAPGINALRLGPDGQPHLMAANSASPHEKGARTALIEPIAAHAHGPAPRALFLNNASHRVMLNGVRSPRLAILGKGDEFHFDDSCAFTVAIYYRPAWGPVPAHAAGAACPVCTIPLQAGERSLACPCGALFHAAEDESATGALACARMASVCSRCEQPLRLEPGYDDFTPPYLTKDAHA